MTKKELKAFYLRLLSQAAKSGWTQSVEKEVTRDIFIAKMKCTDIERELCIKLGATADYTLKSALLQEMGYARARVFRRQKSFQSRKTLKIKQDPTNSIQTKNSWKNRANRALGNSQHFTQDTSNQARKSHHSSSTKSANSAEIHFEPQGQYAARKENSNLCDKRGHFAKCCNSTKPQVSNVASEVCTKSTKNRLIFLTRRVIPNIRF